MIKIAIENRSSNAISEVRKALVEYVGTHPEHPSVELVPSEPIDNDCFGEPELLTYDGLRHADMARTVYKADIGVSFVSGLISAPSADHRFRRTYQTIAIVAAAEKGAIGIRFPPNTIPDDLLPSLDAAMIRLSANLEVKNKGIDKTIFSLGQFLVNTLASFSYTADGETLHPVN